MTDWKPGDSDRRSHNPGLSGDVGELRGTLQLFISQQIQSWATFHDELKDQRESHERYLKEVNTKLDALAGWKSEMTGGMKVAAFMWKAWASVVTIVLGWLSYWRGHP